ncbi:unnamed protein product [Macrosiphum euphorbiae]|uniref:DDE Tnp4 domain-containing protein n=1 Tax=Macrosiphum euphorbiae TaxID=13131 RepID=A0AAV0Y5H8_9HEMI|nr:unnamed protein product [Macrosiphum euphorbiae]
MYKKNETNQEHRMDRYQRAQKVTSDNILHSVGIQDHCDYIITSTDEGNNLMNQFKEVSTQVAFENSVNKNFVFSCEFVGSDVCTQATIQKNCFNLASSVQDKSCGPDSLQVDSCLSYNKFHGFDCIKDENQLKDLTGVTFKVFNLLLPFLSDSNKNLLDIKSQLLLFLIKIKLGITFSALSVFLKISRRTASKIFFKLFDVICSKTKNFIFWPDKYSITQTLPNSFKINYPNCRCIIDCTEIKVEQPSTVEQCVYLYSTYKSCYTVKTLVAVPNGMISFLSKCYGGRTSDSFITNDSGFLEKLEPGDEVLADKGFPGIKTECENNN